MRLIGHPALRLPEDVGDVAGGLDALHSARREDGEGHRGAFGPLIGPRKQPVLTTDRHAPKLALDNPVVDLESAVLKKSRQHFPVPAQVRRPFRSADDGVSLGCSSSAQVRSSRNSGSVWLSLRLFRVAVGRRRAPRPCRRARALDGVDLLVQQFIPIAARTSPPSSAASNLRRECMWHPRRTMAPSDASAIVSKPAYSSLCRYPSKSTRHRGGAVRAPVPRIEVRNEFRLARDHRPHVPALDTRRMVAVEHAQARVVDIHIRRGEHPLGDAPCDGSERVESGRRPFGEALPREVHAEAREDIRVAIVRSRVLPLVHDQRRHQLRARTAPSRTRSPSGAVVISPHGRHTSFSRRSSMTLKLAGKYSMSRATSSPQLVRSLPQ